VSGVMSSFDLQQVPSLDETPCYCPSPLID
jgi:hypothetical protein